jgi:hypothetical protein
MSGMTPDDDLRKRFLNHPSDLTHPTPTQVGQRIHRVKTVRGSTGGREIYRGFSDFQILMKADTQISRSGVAYMPTTEAARSIADFQIFKFS